LSERWDDAELHFEHALVANAKSGALPWLAHTRADYGRMLQTRGEDGGRADELLAAARAAYRQLDMQPYAESLGEPAST
jgi:hypothetical protein